MQNQFIEEKIADIYDEYQKRLVENNAMDFDDLLLKPIEMFNKNPKILQKYKKKFNYFWSMNFRIRIKLSMNLLKFWFLKMEIFLLSEMMRKVFTAGAVLIIDNMLDFQKDFPKNKIFKLEQNYRSTKTILNAADSVIKNNKEQIIKTLWTENNDGNLLL